MKKNGVAKHTVILWLLFAWYAFFQSLTLDLLLHLNLKYGSCKYCVFGSHKKYSVKLAFLLECLTYLHLT